MAVRNCEFKNGLTVRELKAIIREWPETKADGELAEVWIETGWGKSSIVVETKPLNVRKGKADLLFESNAFYFEPKQKEKHEQY